MNQIPLADEALDRALGLCGFKRETDESDQDARDRFIAYVNTLPEQPRTYANTTKAGWCQVLISDLGVHPYPWGNMRKVCAWEERLRRLIAKMLSVAPNWHAVLMADMASANFKWDRP